MSGAGVEAGGGEEVGRIVERAVDLLAGGKAGLRGREQGSGILQGEQILADCRGKDDIGHLNAFLEVCFAGCLLTGQRATCSQPKENMNKSF